MAITFNQLTPTSFSCVKECITLGTIFLDKEDREHHFKPIDGIVFNRDDLNDINLKQFNLDLDYTYHDTSSEGKVK